MLNATAITLYLTRGTTILCMYIIYNIRSGPYRRAHGNLRDLNARITRRITGHDRVKVLEIPAPAHLQLHLRRVLSRLESPKKCAYYKYFV